MTAWVDFAEFALAFAFAQLEVGFCEGCEAAWAQAALGGLR